MRQVLFEGMSCVMVWLYWLVMVLYVMCVVPSEHMCVVVASGNAITCDHKRWAAQSPLNTVHKSVCPTTSS